MAVIRVRIGEDAQVISVTNAPSRIKDEVRAARTFRDAVGIVERRLPSPSPTIEFERWQALNVIDRSTHLTADQKATAGASIRSATEFDKIVFDGPHPLPEGGQVLDQPAAQEGAPPPKKPLVIVFLDP